MDAINKWLEIRGQDDCPYVFVSKLNGEYKQIGEATFNNWSNIYFEKIVGRRFHPHLLRETRATTLVVEQGKDIKTAQKLLDHKSSTTTEIYVIRKDEEDADEEESEEESKPRIIMQSTTITISTRGKAKIPKELEDMFCKKSPGIPEELEEILRGRGV